jgi:hypothetical protein
VQRLVDTHPENVRHARVHSPGLFLSQLYSALTSRHPSSRVQYLAHAERPIVLTQRPEYSRPKAPGITVWRNGAGNFFLFDNWRDAGGGEDSSPPLAAPSASERLLEFVNRHHQHLIPLWIDLAAHYTLQGVVGAIIDQCRLHDPDLAPSVLPLGPPGQHRPQWKKAVDRVREALSRNKYLLVFDALETYPWPQTVHHDTLSEEVEDATAKLRELTDFLVGREDDRDFVEGVVGGPKARPGPAGGAGNRPAPDGDPAVPDGLALHSSVVCVAVNRPKMRRPDPTENSKVILKVCRECRDRLQRQARQLAYEIADPAGLADLEPEVKSLPDVRLSELLAVPTDKTLKRLQDLGMDEIDARLALLCLCCFRRTRSLVALRSILGPLVPGRKGQDPNQDWAGPHAALDQVLDVLEEEQYLLVAEGGYYWMQRDLRDTIYSLNSHSTSRSDPKEPYRRHVANDGPAGEGEDVVRALRPLLGQDFLLAFHHSRIARYYYSENYVQSHDALAFFEYAYHRVSSIRYLAQLLEVFDHYPCGSPVSGEFTDYLAGLSKEVFLPKDKRPRWRSRYLDLDRGTKESLREFDEAAQRHDPRAMRAALGRIRCDEVRSFQLAWRRSRLGLQLTVPAEQLISWCLRIRDHDLNRFLLGAAPQGGENDPYVEAVQLVKKGVEQLKDELDDLISRCSFERTDFETSVDLRAGQAFEALKEAAPARAETPGETCDLQVQALLRMGAEHTGKGEVPFRDARFRRSWLSVASCLIEMQRSRPAASPGGPDRASTFLDPALEYFESAARRLPTKQDLEGDERALWLAASPIRFYHLWALAHLAKHPPWRYTPPAEAGAGPDDQGGPAAEAEAAALTGLDLIRYQPGEEELPSNHRVYFLYRSLFLAALGTASWRLGWPHGQFKSAYRDFDLARSGLGPSDRLYTAEAELAAAECALADAHRLLDEDRLDEATAKHTNALGSLRRARGHLMNSRRNVLWWLEYNRLAAIYSSDRNLWRLARLIKRGPARALPAGRTGGGEGGGASRPSGPPQEEGPENDHELGRDVGRFLHFLREGLLAINYGIDLQLTERASWSPWITQASRELLLGAAVYGCLACLQYRHYQAQKKPTAAPKTSRAESPDGGDLPPAQAGPGAAAEHGPIPQVPDWKDLQGYLKHLIEQVGLETDLCKEPEPLRPHGPPLFTAVVAKCEEIMQRLPFAEDLHLPRPEPGRIIRWPAMLRREILLFAGEQWGGQRHGRGLRRLTGRHGRHLVTPTWTSALACPVERQVTAWSLAPWQVLSSGTTFSSNPEKN